MGETSFHISLHRLYRMYTLHDAPVSQFFSPEGDYFVWDFHFFWPRHDREGKEVIHLVSILASFFSPANPYP